MSIILRQTPAAPGHKSPSWCGHILQEILARHGRLDLICAHDAAGVGSLTGRRHILGIHFVQKVEIIDDGCELVAEGLGFFFLDTQAHQKSNMFDHVGVDGEGLGRTFEVSYRFLQRAENREQRTGDCSTILCLCYSLFIFDLNMQFLELLWFGRGGGVGHHIPGGLVLGEGDHFADIGFVGQQHDQPVDAGSHPAVRGRAELEGFQHVPELALGFLFTDAEQAEDLALDVAPVDTDRAGGHLVAVADHIVGIRKDGGRVGLEAVQVLQTRHGEHVMGGIPFLVFLVPFEHGEIQHPGEGHHIRVGQFERVAEPQAAARPGLCEPPWRYRRRTGAGRRSRRRSV